MAGHGGRRCFALGLTQKFQSVGGTVSLGGMKATLTKAGLKGATLTFDAIVKHEGADEPLHFEG